MDDDDLATQALQCDVELDFSGPKIETLNRWAADVLRRLADSIEENKLDSGWHEMKDSVGKPVGRAYIDYSAYGER